MIRTGLNNARAYTAPKKKASTVGTTGQAQAFGFGATPTPTTSSTPPATFAEQQNAPMWQPPSTSLPWDSMAQQTVDNATTGFNITSGNIDAQENAAGLQYGVGFDRNIDPATGLARLGNFRLDYTNPYSRASAMKKAYQQRQTGNTNSMAARGQLYSGALQNAQNAAQGDFNQGNNDLLTGFGSLGQQFWDKRYGAYQEKVNAPINAQGGAIDRAAANPPAQPAQATPQNVNEFPNAKAWLDSLGGQLVITNEGTFIRLPNGELKRFGG